MAYIVGIISAEERAILERRGWEVEEAPEELIPKRSEDQSYEEWKELADRYAMVFVDTSMFDVMSGPDWDTEEKDGNE